MGMEFNNGRSTNDIKTFSVLESYKKCTVVCIVLVWCYQTKVESSVYYGYNKVLAFKQIKLGLMLKKKILKYTKMYQSFQNTVTSFRVPPPLL